MTVGGTTYGTSPALVAPASFTLTVLDACSGTTVTGSAVNAITLKVWDLETVYPASGAAFSDFTDSVSSANGDPNLCAKTYSASVSTNTGGVSLSNFVFNPSTK